MGCVIAKTKWKYSHSPLYLYYYTFYHSDCLASDPANGAVTPTTAVHGNSVTFSCDQGYVIQGDATAVCNDGTLTAATCAPGNQTNYLSLFNVVSSMSYA